MGADPLADVKRRMAEILSRLRYVKTGDVVRPEDHNDLVDFAVATLELATRIVLTGRLPEWAPILDVGKLDYMIVGEPRTPIVGTPPGVHYWERKPVYGYLYESDVISVVRELNAQLGYERFPDLHFGDVLTSDTWNSWWDALEELASKASLPYRLMAMGPDAGGRLMVVPEARLGRPQVSVALLRLEVGLRVE